jgi:plastocyanin
MSTGRLAKAALFAAGGLSLVAGLPAGAGAATTITVEPVAGENSYAPKRVRRPLGDSTFVWIWGPDGGGTSDPHDVEQNAGLFDSGELQTEGSYEVTAPAGTFPYFCSVHFEMRGRIAVIPAGGEAYPAPFKVSWSMRAASTGGRFDVRYRAAGGPWRTWLEDTERRAAVFGRERRPLRVRDGASYRFQVRTLRTDRKRSGWSPPLVVGS